MAGSHPKRPKDTIASYFKQFTTSKGEELKNCYLFDEDKLFLSDRVARRPLILDKLPTTSTELRAILDDPRVKAGTTEQEFKSLKKEVFEVAKKFENQEQEKKESKEQVNKLKESRQEMRDILEKAGKREEKKARRASGLFESPNKSERLPTINENDELESDSPVNKKTS